MNIVLLGPPGAGKGTQGERIARELGVDKLATGDVLREAVGQGTPLGREAKAFMERGDLVPDDVIMGVVKQALAKPGMERGVILDGVVRTVPQAEGLEKAMRDLGRQVDVVLMFDVGEEELVRRLGGRTTCEKCQTPYTGREAGSTCDKPGCGGKLIRRKDDEPEAIRNRMRAYRAQTEPVVGWYQKSKARFIALDAVGDVDGITARALEALGRGRE